MWFRKKKKGTSPEHEILNNINNNMRSSFARVKKDIQSTSGWITYFKDKEHDQDERLQNIESRLDEVSEVLNFMQQSEETFHSTKQNTVLLVEEEKPEHVESGHKIFQDLTDTQKSIFYRLGTLLHESSQQWMTAKALAQELYPEKPYDQVRSTLSEYTGILIEAGLLRKKRKGKLIYLSITKKGLTVFKKSIKSKRKKLLINNKK
jgi:hypothetical protein